MSEQHPEKPDNTIYVGKKNVMAYVLAVVTQFNQGARNVTVKARGKSISKAVDITQIVKNRFIQTLKVENIELATEEIPNEEDGRVSKVSSMEITLSK